MKETGRERERGGEWETERERQKERGRGKWKGRERGERETVREGERKGKERKGHRPHEFVHKSSATIQRLNLLPPSGDCGKLSKFEHDGWWRQSPEQWFTQQFSQ